MASRTIAMSSTTAPTPDCGRGTFRLGIKSSRRRRRPRRRPWAPSPGHLPLRHYFPPVAPLPPEHHCPPAAPLPPEHLALADRSGSFLLLQRPRRRGPTQADPPPPHRFRPHPA